MLRDNQCATGKGANFDLNFILDNAAVRMAQCDDHPEPYPVISFTRKSAREIWKVFQSREEMFNKVRQLVSIPMCYSSPLLSHAPHARLSLTQRLPDRHLPPQVYLHEKSTGRELLLGDMLRTFQTLPEPACHVIAGKTLEQATSEPSSFILLDDHIITRLRQRLEDWDLEEQAKVQHGISTTSAKDLTTVKRVRSLLELYSRHSHYTKLVEHILLDTHTRKSAAELQDEWGLDPDRFVVCKRVVHHGDGEDNPMRNMRFFDLKRESPNDWASTLSDKDWSLVPLPRHFATTTVCVFFRGDDQRSVTIGEARRDALRAWHAAGFPDRPLQLDDTGGGQEEEYFPSSQGM